MITPDRLRQRAAFLKAVRCFFEERDYLEVDTPIRLPAPAPEAHIEPEPSGDWYLQTSPELCMKRLLAAGHPRLFQICRCFRRGERGRYHLPEFTMLEWYRTGIDYRQLMQESEELCRYLAVHLGKGDRLQVGGESVSLVGPWERLSVAAAFARYAPIPVEEALATDRFEEMLVERVEPHLGRGGPTFLLDYPLELGALARPGRDNPAVAERFEIYLHGLELANGFSELTDPGEQRRRFVADQKVMASLGRRPGPLPEKFLAELGAMPEAAGIALGLDRLFMLFAGAESLDEVVAFPPEDL